MIRNLLKHPVTICVLSGFCLVLAYPKYGVWGLAWAALAPMMATLEGRSPKQAFGLGYLSGVVFFGGTLYWFVNMSSTAGIPLVLAILAYFLIVLYLAVYFGLFACISVFFQKKNVVLKMFLYPSLWVVLEFLRGKLFSGFGWVSLGHSQYKVLPIIQIADLTGVWGISFLVMMVNYFIKEVIAACKSKTRIKKLVSLRMPAAVLALFLAATLGYGFYRLPAEAPSQTMKVAIVQGNIPQELKWYPPAWPKIMKNYLALTSRAAENSRPDLIIWPETSFPGYIWAVPERFEELKAYVAELKIPLLLGTVRNDGDQYFNAAILISREGEVVEEHHKMHLVPFGEFIPFRKYIPFLADILQNQDFTAGEKSALFPASPFETLQRRDKQHFSVLICFEDTISYLARDFVNKGANLLVNITNDAWFLDTKEPFLHLQAAVFRTVENRRALIRVANTGVSCFIDSRGRINQLVQNDEGKTTYVPGYAVGAVALSEEKSLYTKIGDVFTYLCFGFILWGIIFLKEK